MFEMRKEYALYKGEKLIASGSVAEIAKIQGVKPATILFYMSPTYKKRSRNGMCLVLLTDDLMKICRVCEEEKMLIQFYKSRSSKDGYQSKCISCARKSKRDSDFIAKSLHTPSAALLKKMEWHQTLRILA